MQLLTAVYSHPKPRVTRGATLPLCLAEDRQWYVYKQEHEQRARVRDDLIAGGSARVISPGTHSMTGMIHHYLVLDHASVSTDNWNMPTQKVLGPSEATGFGGPVMVWFPDKDIFVGRIATDTLVNPNEFSSFNPESIDADDFLSQTIAQDLFVLMPGQTIVTKRFVDDDYEKTVDGFWSYDGHDLFVNGKKVEDNVLWA